MIYVTGDTHGELGRFYGDLQSETNGPSAGDFLIVCGDFGFVFQIHGTVAYMEEKRALDALSELPYTILFVDGNHENFDRLNSEYETETWNGGKIHRIRDNVFHLMRGQVFEIEGKKIFTMGGGYSMDKAMRREGFSWWSDEMPSNEDYREATRNLREHSFAVDIIISHTAPSEIVYAMGSSPDLHEIELNGFFDWILHEVSFDKWYFGHWHRDEEHYGKFRAVYFDVLKI